VTVTFSLAFVKIPFSFKVVDARIDARPGNSKLVLSICKVKVLVQSRIREFYPVSGFQPPVSLPASTTSNQFLQIQFRMHLAGSPIIFRIAYIVLRIAFLFYAIRITQYARRLGRPAWRTHITESSPVPKSEPGEVEKQAL